MIELEPIEGKATLEQLAKFREGALSEYKELNKHLKNFKEFIINLETIHCLTDEQKEHNVFNNENVVSTEAASQHIGYLESKIMESIGTLDKIALEMAAQIDRVKQDANTTTIDRERLENTE